MITPMTGDGQAMAIEGASLLAPRLDALLAALDAPGSQVAVERAGQEWAAAWARHFRVRHGLGRAAQALLVRPRAAEAALRLGAAIPALPRLIARATRGAL